MLTYDDGAVVNLGVSYALPEKYPALGHAARVEVVGTGGVLILDDDHTDQLMYSETGVPHVYLPDHNVNMVFLQSGTPGDWALGEFWGPIANEITPGSIISSTDRPCTLATPQDARMTLGGDACDRAFDADRHAGDAAAARRPNTGASRADKTRPPKTAALQGWRRPDGGETDAAIDAARREARWRWARRCRAGAARAAGYPDRPVKIIAPFAAGRAERHHRRG